MHELAEKEGLSLQRRSAKKTWACRERWLEPAEKEGLSLQRRLEPVGREDLGLRGNIFAAEIMH